MKKVIVLATGGTIAGRGEEGRETNYSPGVMEIEHLLSTVPELKAKANISAIQICNVNSDDITDTIWIKLARCINEEAKKEDVAGFVITHGTDTLEETAYFLNLVVKTDKPVVLTGSMRPSTALSPDGPINLYQAVCTAEAEESKGKGVLVLFSNLIYSARSVQKVSTYDVQAIGASVTGCIGIVRNDQVFYFESPSKRHTINSEFDVSNIESLPKVGIVYFAIDADERMIGYAASISSGLVIAGAGAGEFSKKFQEVLSELTIPVVISTRVDISLITPDSILCSNGIASNNLSPQKSALLLRLALTKTNDRKEIERIFNEY